MRYAPYALIAIGAIVLLVGGLGIADGIGGVMPREAGAAVLGIALMIIGLVGIWRNAHRDNEP